MIARSLLFVAALTLCASAHAETGAISETFPEEANPAARYVIYHHGAVAEGLTVARPYSAHFGTYQKPELEQALADPAWELIVPRRPRGAPSPRYGAILAANVQKLLDEGVPPEHIALIGFSKGGQVVSVASNRLRSHPIHVVLLAACWDWVAKAPNISLGGAVLSMRDASDPVLSCRALAEHGDGARSFEEIVTKVGEAHGTFYKPNDAWVKPLRAWLRKQLAIDADRP